MMRRSVALILGGFFCAGALSCAELGEPRDPAERFGEAGFATVTEEIAFTSEPYDFTGETPIGDLRALIPDQPAFWIGLAQGDQYPVPGDCDPQFGGNALTPQQLSELPAVIEGVVTLHPRYFMKVTVCGTEERYYGSYIIQDGSTGIFVLKDSRVAEFDVGDRVRLRVRSLLKNFSDRAVLGFDMEEVLTTRDTREPIYYEEIERRFNEADDLYEVRRITGIVEIEATNQNFNEMLVRSESNPNISWFVSLDREIGSRGVAPREGDRVQLTGPVVESFGLRMLIANLGLIEVLDPAE